MNRKKKKIVKDYITPYPDHFNVRVGEKLEVYEKKSEWPGWVWCKTATGKESWVPAQYLKREATGFMAINDYDAKELTVKKNELIEILKEESGWAWCRKENGEEGWLPLECVSDR